MNTRKFVLRGVDGERYQPPPLEELQHSEHEEDGPSPRPQVYVEKDGDRITQIHVICSCGGKVTIECGYKTEEGEDAAPKE